MPPQLPTRLFATALALLATSTAMAIEEPAFRLVERDGAFELREYAPHAVAETRVEASFTDAGNTAFQRLFRYISGNNVVQQKIAMTAPVTQVDAGDGYRVAFTLPASYTLETAPIPLDRTIEVRVVPAQLVATWRYSGRWTESNYREHEAALRAAIAARNLKVTGEPVLARYNPPFMPSFLRRNEVMILVERSTSR